MLSLLGKAFWINGASLYLLFPDRWLILLDENAGVMQDYYHQIVFGENYPNIIVLLSLTRTLCLVCTNGLGEFVQILVSYVGATCSMIIGTLLLAMGLIFAGSSTQVWHLYLTQGICFGIGSSICYTSMGVIPQYFDRKRGLIMGIVTSGSGVGGLVISFIMDAINQSLGAAWTYRILGFICLACNTLAIILVMARIPRRLKGRKKKLSDIVQLGILKDVNFDLWCTTACLQVMGYFLPYSYLLSYSTWLGLTASDGTALVAVASAANVAGRILAGVVADRIEHLNTNMTFTFLNTLSSFLVWTFSCSYGVLMAFAVNFGLLGSSYPSLISPVTASVFGMEKLATGFSLVAMFTVIAVFSPMISSAIEDSVDAELFYTYKVYTGVAFILSSITASVLKLKMKRNLFIKI